MTRARIAPLAATALLGAATASHAQSPHKFELEPIVIDGSNSTGATVGVQWLANGSLLPGRKSPGGRKLSLTDLENAVIKEFTADYKLSGTATLDRTRNPKNFLDALVDAKYLYDAPFIALAGGAFVKYESDQSFDNTQAVYGLRMVAVKFDIVRERDWVMLSANAGQVDPSKDKAREAALGTTDLERFYRWDFEFGYKVPVHDLWKQAETLELNYRYFRENSPPAAVRSAGLDQYRLGQAKLVLKKEYFIAYSRGKLPFDRESDKILEIGWTHNLK